MLNYLVFGIAIIIFATVIIISGKAISRGIEAKQNMKDKPEDEKKLNVEPDEEPDENDVFGPNGEVEPATCHINSLRPLGYTRRILFSPPEVPMFKIVYR